MKAWIARSKDGSLCLFTKKPNKIDEWWFGELNIDGFDNVKWTDDEPTEVEVTINKK